MPTQPTSPAQLSLRWALILMAACGVAVVVGALTLLQTLSWPGAILAALGAAGVTIPSLHQVIGK